jgi:transmembrane sensor
MNDKDGKADARAEAAQWYARLQSLPVSRDTLEEFFAWRRLPGHADAFLTVEQLHIAAGQLAGRAAIRAVTEDAYQRGLKRGLGGRSRAVFAAGMAVLLIAGSLFFLPRLSRDQSFLTSIGEQREVALEDGSIVKLDTDSVLSTHYTRDARHIRLVRGQAYFTVAHNAERPFIVDAGPASVTATGTQFDVRRTGDRTDVTLVQGGVDIRSGDSISHLVSGQKLRVQPGQKPVPETADTSSITAWTHGRLLLQGASLTHAIDEVNRYTDHPVRLDDQAFADAKFSGALNTGDVPAFIAAVTALLPLRAVTDETGSVHLVGQAGSIQGRESGTERKGTG